MGNQCCLSDRDIELMRTFVKNGGGLVATGDTSLYDENFSQRHNYRLADIFGVSYSEGKRERKRIYKKDRVIFTPQTHENVPYDRVGYQHRAPLPARSARLVRQLRFSLLLT